jgi:hypothetical protein
VRRHTLRTVVTPNRVSCLCSPQLHLGDYAYNMDELQGMTGDVFLEESVKSHRTSAASSIRNLRCQHMLACSTRSVSSQILTIDLTVFERACDCGVLTSTLLFFIDFLLSLRMQNMTSAVPYMGAPGNHEQVNTE